MHSRSFLALLLGVLILAPLPPSLAQTNDLVFIHHSVGNNWLGDGLDAALAAKDYIDERNDITYSTDVSPDSGRPDSLAATPGDLTDMRDWIRWFNDYLDAVLAYDAADGFNQIVMFKSCYPNSNIGSDGTEPGDPFSWDQTIANYRAVYRHPSGSGNTYTDGGYTYDPLEEIFADNPGVLFIPVTAPPRHYAPGDATDDAEAHRARVFNDWLKNDWLTGYRVARPGLNNVAVFDLFDLLAYPDDHPTHPNRLRSEYGGAAGDSHPNTTANTVATEVFATDPNSFIDTAWALFAEGASYLSLSITPDAMNENGGTATATVTRASSDVSGALVVTVTSGDVTEATVPATVTILADEVTQTFAVTAVDDAGWDGNQAVTITVSADGYGAGHDGVTVRDDDGPNVTYGSLFQLPASLLGQDWEGTEYADSEFAETPHLRAEYVDPVSGAAKGKTVKVRTKVISGSPVAEVQCEWKSKVPLFDQKAIPADQTLKAYLTANPIAALDCDLSATVHDSTGTPGPFAAGGVRLVSPTITGVADAGGLPITSAGAGDVITLVGSYFGPKLRLVGLEYAAGDGTIKIKKCKILKPLRYPDAKGNAGMSCMDLNSATGTSEVSVQLPATWPVDWDLYSTEHNLVVNNKIGRATIDFGTDP